MSNYRSDQWQKLAERRQRRKITKSKLGSHPLSHVDPDKCHEWMRADSATYELARQSREDGLISTITQIASASLLGIPGLIFGSSQSFPKIVQSPALYIGLAAFLITLMLAMLEQFLSAKAYRRQTKIAQQYYQLESDRTDDSSFVRWVRWCRNVTCLIFGVAVIVSAYALITLERPNDGKSSATSATSSSTTTAAASTKLYT